MKFHYLDQYTHTCVNINSSRYTIVHKPFDCVHCKNVYNGTHINGTLLACKVLSSQEHLRKLWLTKQKPYAIWGRIQTKASLQYTVITLSSTSIQLTPLSLNLSFLSLSRTLTRTGRFTSSTLSSRSSSPCRISSHTPLLLDFMNG